MRIKKIPLVSYRGQSDRQIKIKITTNNNIDMNKLNIRLTLLGLILIASSLAHAPLRAEEGKYPFYHSFDIGLGRIGYFAEKNVADNFSLGLRASIDNEFGFLIRGISYYDREGKRINRSASGFMYSFSPSLALGANWYYNLRSLRDSGYDTRHNAANYFSLWVTPVSLQNLVASRDLHPYTASSATLSWGSRRIVGDSFMYHYQIGAYASYIHANKHYMAQWTIGPAVSAGVGYIF